MKPYTIRMRDAKTITVCKPIVIILVAYKNNIIPASIIKAPLVSWENRGIWILFIIKLLSKINSIFAKILRKKNFVQVFSWIVKIDLMRNKIIDNQKKAVLAPTHNTIQCASYVTRAYMPLLNRHVLHHNFH